MRHSAYEPCLLLARNCRRRAQPTVVFAARTVCRNRNGHWLAAAFTRHRCWLSPRALCFALGYAAVRVLAIRFTLECSPRHFNQLVTRVDERAVIATSAATSTPVRIAASRFVDFRVVPKRMRRKQNRQQRR